MDLTRWRTGGFQVFQLFLFQMSKLPEAIPPSNAEAPLQNAVPHLQNAVPLRRMQFRPQWLQLTLLLKPSPPQVANFQSVPLQPGLLAQVAGLHLPEPAQGVGVQGPQVHVAPGGVGPAVVQGHGMNNVQLDANFAMNVAAMADQRAFLSLQTCCRLAKA